MLTNYNFSEKCQTKKSVKRLPVFPEKNEIQIDNATNVTTTFNVRYLRYTYLKVMRWCLWFIYRNRYTEKTYFNTPTPDEGNLSMEMYMPQNQFLIIILIIYSSSIRMFFHKILFKKFSLHF